MISRRKFLGKSLKAMALAIAAPLVLPHVKSTANPIPPQPTSTPNITGENLNKGDEIGFRRYNSKYDCVDYCPNVTIQEYVPGETIKFQDLGANPSCDKCLYFAKCTCKGKHFEDSLALWNKKLQARLYKEAFLTKFV